MKKVLNFPNFSKMFEKRAYSTPHAPKTANENFENLKFSKFSFAVLGAGGVSQDKIFKIFGKFGKFKTFFIPLVSPYGKYSPSNFRLKMGQKGGKNDKNGRYSMFPIW